MERERIAVSVAGQNFIVVSDQGKEYIDKVAEKVDEHINSIMSGSSMSREKCAVLTALDFADDEARSRQEMEEIRQQIKDYIETISKLKKENEVLKAGGEDLVRIKQENSTLKVKIENIEKIRKENDDLKLKLAKADATIKELSQLKEKAKNAERQANEKEDIIVKLNREKKAEIENFQSEKEKLQNCIKDLNNRLKNAIAESAVAKELQEEIERLKEENENIKKSLEQEEQEVREAKEVNEEKESVKEEIIIEEEIENDDDDLSFEIEEGYKPKRQYSLFDPNDIDE